jgi:sarcosine oxidase subunit beta
MTTADVVVIGGGVNGTSTAYYLAKLGAGKIILVERGQLAAGATGKSGALVRMHYTNPHESKLAYESLKVFRNWADEVGGECGWQNPGFVQIVGAGYESNLAANVADQQAIGINTRLVSREELRERFPGMYVDDIGAAAFEADSGWADPNQTTYAFAEAARRLGVEIRTGCEVEKILTEHGRVTGVETSQGTISTGAVVAAPGVRAPALLADLGLDFQLTPYRSAVAIFRWPDGFEGPMPVVIDAINDAWLRPESSVTTLIGAESGSFPGSIETYDETIRPEVVDAARQTLASRFPAFKHALMRGGWAGMYMMSPDHHPIIDQTPSVGGLYVMIGDSGSSFKTGPAVGKCLAEWVVNGEPQTADLTPFRSTRFAEGQPWIDDTNRYGRGRRTISR